MTLSTRIKEAIKTGLAMAIAYGIALQMDWDRPYRAAFAVAFISLPTAGQSLHKGVSLAKIKSSAFMSNSRAFQTTYLMHLS